MDHRLSPYLVVLTLSLFFGYLLSCAFPYGIIHADTGSYLELGRTLSFSSAGMWDWTRTPPFALLLLLSTFTSEPTATVIWFYLFLFTVNIVLAFWFALGIFGSRFSAFIFASIALFLEVSLMRTFYYNTQILADPLLAHLILMGSLLSLGGWIHRTPLALVAGAFALGLAAFTKPVGIALFPLWIPFFIWVTTTNEKPSISPRALTIVCLALLFGPTLIWSSRNALLYGHFQPTAYGGRNILPRVLPLLKDTDIVLDNLQKNRTFIEEVRALEREVGTEYNHYAWGNVPGRIGYFGILDTLTTEYQETGESLSSLGVKWDVIALNQRFFAIDPLAIRTALRIIRLHPGEYLAIVSEGYLALFDMIRRDLGLSAQLQAPPDQTYQGVSGLHEGTLLALYPPTGLPDPEKISPLAREILARFALPSSFLRLRFFPSFVVLAHTMFFWSIAFLWCQKRRKPPVTLYAPVSFVMLFLTAASHYLLTSATEFPLERYALPGEMGLNLALLLTIFLMFQWLFFRAKDAYWCCRHHSSNHKSAHRCPE